MENIFEKNLKALKKLNPHLANKIESIKGNEKYEVFIGNDPANINILDKERKETIYIDSPLKETINKLSFLKKKQKYPFLYFFGLGNGIFYKLLIESFSSLKKVVVFEPELEIIYIVFNLIDLSSYIEEEKLIIIPTSYFSFSTAVSVLAKDEASLYSKLYELELLTAYYNNYKEEIIETNSTITRALHHIIFSVGNDAIDSLIGLEHHIQNFDQMIETPTFKSLTENAKNSEIAVIVSTGPSLMKQLPLLKEIQDSVTILSVDASFPILFKHGIKPDIVLSLERVEETAGFYENLPDEAFEGVIFAITSIAHEKLLKNIKNKRNLQINMRPFNYLKYFKTDPWGYLGKGMSAANMAFELAYYADFKKLVLIGQDLAFGEDGTSHAKEHTRGKNEIDVKKSSVTLPAYGGKGEVKSTLIWKAFLNFFESDINETKEFMTTFNATEGGARIEGAIEIPFKKFIDEHVDRNFKKSEIKLKRPSEKSKKKYKKIFDKRLNSMKEKLEKIKKECEETFLHVIGFLEEIEELNRQKRVEEIDFKRANELLNEIDHIKQYFEEEEFFSMVFEFVRSYLVSQELEIAKIQVKHIQNDMDRKVQTIEWLYAHKFWLFSLAGGLDAILTVIERASAKREKEENKETAEA